MVRVKKEDLSKVHQHPRPLDRESRFCTMCCKPCDGTLCSLTDQYVCSVECAEKLNLKTIPGYAETKNTESSEIKDTLKERGVNYGAFKTHAIITQNLKLMMHQTERWSSLTSDQQECLDMIVHKIGRILNGNPDYIDSWRDIIGYTQLVIDILQVKEGATDSKNVRIKYVDGEWK